ncbi:MAG: CHAT domain-containing protein [Runella slithyformis]|nr:MAG: CHAT domain-containing protein [Runella slithyformis]TAF48537.1 MAG: CHAT domain-containing protein [Runella slithyformis]TAF83335.1 MAG: CHAT domain-containing protein [Runella slithyformis]
MIKRQIICLLVFGWTLAAAQCPPKIAIWQTLEKHINTAATDDQLTAECIKLKQQYEKCKYPPDSIYAKIMHVMGRGYAAKGDSKRAIWFTQRGIDINANAALASYPANCTNGYLNLLLSYQELNQEKPMLDALKRVIFYAKKYRERGVLEARAYSNVSVFFYEKGDFELSVKYAKNGQNAATAIKNDEYLVENLVMEAQALIALDEPIEAKKVLQKAIVILKANRETTMLASVYSQIARIERRARNYQNAIDYYKNAVNILKPLLANNTDAYIKTNMSVFLNNIGEIYATNLKDYKTALDFYKLAYQYTSNDYDAAQIIANQALVLRSEKKYDQAFSLFQQSFQRVNLVLRNGLPTASSIKMAASKRLLLAIIQDKADTWLDYYKGEPLSHRRGAGVRLQNALKTYALADSMIDFMRYEHAGEGSKLFWRQKTRGMYERAIEAAYLAGDSEMAFRFFEKSKAVLLADKLNELGANQQLSEADTRRQRALRDSIANLQNQLAALPTTDKKRQVLQTRLERFNDDFAAFRKNLETTNPAYYRYKYDNSTPSLYNLSLGEGSFVSYFVGDSAVYGLVIQNQAKLIRLKIQPADYQKLANEFLNLCANRAALNAQYPRYRALAYALYEQLWKPLYINTERVVIAQDGVFLPFEAFLTAPNGSEFLLKRHAISYTYSAKYLKPPYPRWGNFNTSPFVGFAPETFAVGLKQVPLSGSAAVLQEVGQDFWFGKKLVNAEASKASFLRHAPNARVIQLFTHAEADSTEATEPKIYFQDTALRLSELNQTEGFAAQLLVLSACKTGVGANQRGEGVFSLARGFAALGIPSTITTLWSVEDQPTYELTKLFYKYLHQDLPKDVALQRAKLDWLAAGGAADALPSQWAGMILVGDAAPLTSTFSISIIGLVIPTIGWAAIAGILLLLAAFGWWRRRRLS